MAKKPARGFNRSSMGGQNSQSPPLQKWTIHGQDKIHGHMWYNISVMGYIQMWIREQDKEMWNQPWRGKFQRDKMDIREDLLLMVKLKFGK